MSLAKAHLVGDLKDLYEESIDLTKKAFPEGGNGVMVGMAAGGNVAKGHGIIGAASIRRLEKVRVAYP